MINRINFSIFLGLIITACETTSTQEGASISGSDFSMDTVMIDGGDQLIFPYLISARSFFTGDNQFLLNFNDFDHTLEKIDLDKLELTKKYFFEKEGPNGTGEYVDYLVPLDSGKLLVQTSNQAGIFDWVGNKIGGFDPLLEGTSLMHVDRKVFQPVRAAGERIYGIINDNVTNTSEVGWLNRRRNEFSTIPLAKEFRHGDFNLEHIEENSRRRFAPNFIMQAYGENKMVLGSSVSCSLFIFDPETHQLVEKEYNLSLTANEKKGVYNLETEDEAAFQRLYVALNEEVSFGPLLWDLGTKRYYRFLWESKFSEDNPPGRFPQPVSTAVYLLVLDMDLNLVKEMPVPQLTWVPYTSFAKDGTIWMFQNMEDELGFIRLSVDL